MIGALAQQKLFALACRVCQHPEAVSVPIYNADAWRRFAGKVEVNVTPGFQNFVDSPFQNHPAFVNHADVIGKAFQVGEAVRGNQDGVLAVTHQGK